MAYNPYGPDGVIWSEQDYTPWNPPAGRAASLGVVVGLGQLVHLVYPGFVWEPKVSVALTSFKGLSEMLVTTPRSLF